MGNRLSNRHKRKAVTASSTIVPRSAGYQGALPGFHSQTPMAALVPRYPTSQPVVGPASDFVVWVVTYARAHTGVFLHVATNLIASLRKLGYSVEYAYGPTPPARPGQMIVFGANILQQAGLVPPGAIIYQLEQVVSRWIHGEYLRLLRDHPVWDFSKHNVDALQRRFGVRAQLCRVGGSPAPAAPLRRAKDIDVLFYGSRNPRRDVVIAQLKNRGVKVHDKGAWGSDLDELIARSKVVLNIHYYPDAVLEMVRLSHAIERGAHIVTEKGADPDLERMLGDGVTIAPYEKLVNATMKQLALTQAERDITTHKGMAALAAVPYTGELEAAICGSLPGKRPASKRDTGKVKCYINNFNRLTWLKAIANDIVRLGGEPIIIDNASSYPPLLAWYANECPYRVVRLPRNMGSRSPWLSGVLDRELQRGERYVVTDPDLDLSGVPADALELLTQGLSHGVFKAGLSLEIADVPQKLLNVVQINGLTLGAIESKFWKQRINKSFWRADVDTTFAMYRYNGKVTSFGADFVRGVRSDRPYTARHLPWYRSVAEFDDEDRYYAAHRSGTDIQGFKHRNGSWYDSVRKAEVR